MHKVWNNANPKKFGKKHVRDSKLVLNYSRSSGMYPCIKCDHTVFELFGSLQNLSAPYGTIFENNSQKFSMLKLV
jgi:hypothetical protein